MLNPEKQFLYMPDSTVFDNSFREITFVLEIMKSATTTQRNQCCHIIYSLISQVVPLPCRIISNIIGQTENNRIYLVQHVNRTTYETGGGGVPFRIGREECSIFLSPKILSRLCFWI